MTDDKEGHADQRRFPVFSAGSEQNQKRSDETERTSGTSVHEILTFGKVEDFIDCVE